MANGMTDNDTNDETKIDEPLLDEKKPLIDEIEKPVINEIQKAEEPEILIECGQCKFSAVVYQEIKDHFKTHVHCGPNRVCQNILNENKVEMQNCEEKIDPENPKRRRCKKRKRRKHHQKFIRTKIKKNIENVVEINQDIAGEGSNPEKKKSQSGKDEPSKYKCCGTYFYSRQYFQWHLKRHGMDRSIRPENKIECYECGIKLRNMDELKQHEQSHVKENPYACHMCEKTFHRTCDLKRHISKHDIYNCKICHKKFLKSEKFHVCIMPPNPQNINKMLPPNKEHEAMNGQAKLDYDNFDGPEFFEGEEEFACEEEMEDEKERIKKGLIDEIDDEMGPAAIAENASALLKKDFRPYKCHYCDRTFSKTCYMRDHLIVHTNQYPLRCNICDKGFIYKGTLEKHMRNYHGDQVEKDSEEDKKPMSKLERLLLGQSIDDGDGLVISTKVVSNGSAEKKVKTKLKNKDEINSSRISDDDDDDKSNTKKTCPECGKLISRGYLKIHMNAHFGDLPFVCDICGLKLRRAIDLRTHSYTHTKKYPFTCSKCNKGFAYPSLLRSHTLTHMAPKKKPKVQAPPPSFMGGPSHLMHMPAFPYQPMPMNMMTSLPTMDIPTPHAFMMGYSGGKKSHICPSCGKYCKNSNILRAHLLVHTQDKPHRCDICQNRYFKRKSDLNKHLHKFHNDKGDGMPFLDDEQDMDDDNDDDDSGEIEIPELEPQHHRSMLMPMPMPTMPPLVQMGSFFRQPDPSQEFIEFC